MNLDNSTIKIFDLNKTYNLFNLSAKQGDTDGARGILFKIIKDSIPFLLDGLTIQVGGLKPDGTSILNAATIVDVANSIVKIDLTTQMLAVPGLLKLELNFIKDTAKLSSYPFQINVIKSVSDFKTIISTDDFQILNEALQKVNGYNKELENAVNTGKEEVYDKIIKDFDPLKTDINTSISNAENKLNDVEQLKGKYEKSLGELDNNAINNLNIKVDDNTKKINSANENLNTLTVSNLIMNTGFLGAKGATNLVPSWVSYNGIIVYYKNGQDGYNDPNSIYLANLDKNNSTATPAGIYQYLSETLKEQTDYTFSVKGYKEPNVKGYDVCLEFYDENSQLIDTEYLVQGGTNGTIQEYTKTFTTKTGFKSTRIKIEHSGEIDTSVNARYLLIIKDLILVEGKMIAGYTPSFDGIASIDKANAWTDGSYMKLKRDGHGFVTITGYKKITPNPNGTWTRINFPYSLKDANYTVQATAFDGRSDNNFRSVKIGDTLTKDWCEVLAGDIFGFYYTITSSEKY